MTFLVVGGSGFIGLNLIEHLLGSSESVISLDRSPIPHSAINVFSKLSGELTGIQVDISEANDLDQIISDGDVTTIYYGAAITASAEREISNPLSIFDVNLRGLINILKSAGRLQGLVFLTILMTVGIQGLSAKPLANRLELGQKNNLD